MVCLGCQFGQTSFQVLLVVPTIVNKPFITWGRGWMTKASGVGERRKGRRIFSVSREMSVTMTMMMMVMMMMTMMMMTMMMMVMMMMVVMMMLMMMMMMVMMMLMMMMMMVMMMMMMMKRMGQMIGMMMRMMMLMMMMVVMMMMMIPMTRTMPMTMTMTKPMTMTMMTMMLMMKMVVGLGGGPFAWKMTWCPWAAPGILAKARRIQLADASFRDYFFWSFVFGRQRKRNVALHLTPDLVKGLCSTDLILSRERLSAGFFQ